MFIALTDNWVSLIQIDEVKVHLPATSTCYEVAITISQSPNCVEEIPGPAIYVRALNRMTAFFIDLCQVVRHQSPPYFGNNAVL